MYKYFPHYVMYIPDNLDQQKKVQPIEDTGLKLMEWEHKDYDEAGNSELTETYNVSLSKFDSIAPVIPPMILFAD